MVIDAVLLHGVDLNSLLTFFIIYREKSVSGAARQLNVGQPAVSNTLAKLRIYFKDPLFVRHRRSIVPTKTAQAIAEELGSAFLHIQNALSNYQSER